MSFDEVADTGHMHGLEDTISNARSTQGGNELMSSSDPACCRLWSYSRQKTSPEPNRGTVDSMKERRAQGSLEGVCKI